ATTGIAEDKNLLARAAAHLQPDRRPHESEFLPQLVQQEPFIGKVERRRDVREEHERRRRNADLRGVHDAHVLAAGTDRRVRGRDLLEKLVQLRRWDLETPRLADLVDGLENLR